MSKIYNTNYNKVSVKTDSMVKMIEQLSKLGVFKEKEKRKPRKKNKVSDDEIKQDSDMVGSVEPNSNLFSLREIEPGMSDQQIDDIEKRNQAGLAALSAEVQQWRLQNIEEQQRQRFSDFATIFGIDNPVISRFRGAQQPGVGQIPDPFVQSTTIEQIEPDINEQRLTQTLNEGGPKEAPIKTQTDLFAEGEEVAARLGPQERIGGGDDETKYGLLYKELIDEGLKLVNAKKTNIVKLRKYYLKLIDLLGIEDFIESTNANDYKEEIQEIIQSYNV
jgi:hypothetical protein